MNTESTVWMSWHRSGRTLDLAEITGARLLAWQLDAPAWIRHPASAAWTIYWLVALRPRRMILQHSFLLAVLVAAYKRLSPWPVVVVDDCHTKALRRKPRGPARAIFERLRSWSIRSFDCLVLATPTLEPEARALGLPTIVLPDPIPRFSASAEPQRSDPRKDVVLVVGSYAEDEPVTETIDAARRLADVQFRFTGRPPEWVTREKLPSNVRLLGFLPFEDFHGELSSADVVVAVTTHEGTFLRAACEALALDRPLVTSGTEALRDYLGEAAVFVEPDAPSIAWGIREALHDRLALSALAARRRREVSAIEREGLMKLKAVLATDEAGIT